MSFTNRAIRLVRSLRFFMCLIKRFMGDRQHLLVLALVCVVGMQSCGEDAQDKPVADGADGEFLGRYQLTLEYFGVEDKSVIFVNRADSFVIDCRFSDELKNGKLSAELRQVFENNGHPLPNDAVVRIRETSPTTAESRPQPVITGSFDGNAWYPLYVFSSVVVAGGVVECTAYKTGYVNILVIFTLENNTSEELLMNDCLFRIEDRDENVVHKQYELDASWVFSLVSILPGGKGRLLLWFTQIYVTESLLKGKLHLVAYLRDEQVVTELPIDSVEWDGNGFSWGSLIWP